MKNLVSRFNVYDQFGYIFVGLYQILLLKVFLNFTEYKSPFELFDNFKLGDSVVLILLSYLFGHIVQAISNLFSSDRSHGYNPEVLKRAKAFFKLNDDTSEQTVFQYCYLYSLSNDFSGHISLFNSLHSLYRGLMVASGIGLVMNLVYLFLTFWIPWFTPVYIEFSYWVITAIQAVLIVLFNSRKNRFLNYYLEKVLISFDILSKDLIKDDNR